MYGVQAVGPAWAQWRRPQGLGIQDRKPNTEKSLSKYLSIFKMKWMGPWNKLCGILEGFREILVSVTNEAKYLCNSTLDSNRVRAGTQVSSFLYGILSSPLTFY